ncbi:Crp/Fnr family transcriptional regulator [Fusibacter ferrireducens]|uniref:Crp/Fnr family transcriptional regulator n=1 Tax=Fusibacter ferrireducens TaxID=2785058 RepID=A0ABR9ZSE7_9FIRM|nr:Crp/Fnr family transcriptional regulator [Fusibacter ferrireducens]MBF4693382.1 Crp/Fnr family transcriptional regulator [Fusibacter ferrireducens]
MDKEYFERLLIQFMKKFTDMDEASLKELAKDVPIVVAEKGTVLLEQGEAPHHCIFVLKGCIRQYRVDEQGNELTSDFYTEEQWVTIFYERDRDHVSKFSLSCVEECTLVMGPADLKEAMFDQYSALKDMTYKMLEEKIGEIKGNLSGFMSSTPEARVKALQQNRPDLFQRVPQHQLASYLGLTPESLSRIKKRIEKGDK